MSKRTYRLPTVPFQPRHADMQKLWIIGRGIAGDRRFPTVNTIIRRALDIAAAHHVHEKPKAPVR